MQKSFHKLLPTILKTGHIIYIQTDIQIDVIQQMRAKIAHRYLGRKQFIIQQMPKETYSFKSDLQ